MASNLISINIVAYNAQKTLPKTLESILIQQDVQIELIFINDCSTDATLQLIENFKHENPSIHCTIISNPQNLGITKSHNLALEHSKGDFIAVLDSDDVWIHPQKLKKQLDFLNVQSDYIVVGTQMNIVNSHGAILKTTSYKTTDEDIKRNMLVANQIGHSSVLMRNIDLHYDESFYIWEDYALFLKLGSKSKLANLNEVLVEYLSLPKNLTLEKKIKLTSTEIKIIKKYKKIYPNFWVGYIKRFIKYSLILLHLK